MRKTNLLILLILLCQISFSQTNLELLTNIKNNVKKMECVYYESEKGSSLSDDTPIDFDMKSYVKFMFNDSDEALGCKYLISYSDTTKIERNYYDCNYYRYGWQSKTYFYSKADPEFPSISIPFYGEVVSMIDYAISKMDSINLTKTEYSDSLKFTFTFNRPTYFKKKALISQMDETCDYYLWVDKKLMPYKLRKHFSHMIAEEKILYHTKIDPERILKYQRKEYIPEGFQDHRKIKKVYVDVLKGEKAPVWKLENLEGEYKTLNNFQGKNLLIEFTSTSCGHCSAAIPFINKINKKYRRKLKVISIFRNTDAMSRIKKYIELENIEYDVLKADNATFQDYHINGVPVFIFINEDGIVENTHVGFSINKTDKLLTKYVKELIKN